MMRISRQSVVVALFTLMWLVMFLPICTLIYCQLFMDTRSYFSIDLSNGYFLGSSFGGDGGIIRRRGGDTQIGPGVDGYRAFPEMVIGHISCGLHSRCDIPGFFVLDTKKNVVYKGLSKKDWGARLRNCGIDREPQLKSP